MQTLSYCSVPEFPALAWYLRWRDGVAEVFHGSHVETRPDFFTDGAWAGPFEREAAGEAFLCGSAVCAEDDGLRIFTSHTPMERLFVVREGDETLVANSLPLLLAVTDDALDADDFSYRSLFYSLVYGTRVLPRTFRTERRRVRMLLCEVATLSGDGTLDVRPKPLDRDFTSFADYRDHLSATIDAFIANARSERRTHVYEPLVSLSTGYDSVAVAALVRAAGFSRAFTLMRDDVDANGRVDYPDAVARQLGMELLEIDRLAYRGRTDLPEAEIAAAATDLMDITHAALEKHLDGALLFAGHSGDAVWGRTNHRVYRDLVRGGLSGIGLNEYRLRARFIHCPVPYIGHTAHPSLHRIANEPEMAPWSVGGSYDRPVARRIAEEAGVERSAFGREKRGIGLPQIATTRYALKDRATMHRELCAFMTEEGAASFLDYCERVGVERRVWRMRAASVAHWIFKKVHALNYRVGRRLYRFGIQGLVPRRVMSRVGARLSGQKDYTYLLPHWGTEVLKQRYRTALADVAAACEECAA